MNVSSIKTYKKRISYTQENVILYSIKIEIISHLSDENLDNPLKLYKRETNEGRIITEE